MTVPLSDLLGIARDATRVQPRAKPRPALDRLLDLLSPPTYRDSLEALAGRPAGGVEYPPAPWDDGTLGMYMKKRDKILVGPARTLPPQLDQQWDMPRYDIPESLPPPDYTLAHEFGHRYEIRGGAPADSLRRAVRGAYRGGGDFDEATARAFASAVNQLRATASLSPGDARAALSRPRDIFADAPGTAEALRFLLRRPLYRRHPLNVSP